MYIYDVIIVPVKMPVTSWWCSVAVIVIQMFGSTGWSLELYWPSSEHLMKMFLPVHLAKK